MNKEPEVATTQPPNFPVMLLQITVPSSVCSSGPLLQESCWGGGWLRMALLQVEIVVLLMKLWHSGPGIGSWHMTVTQPH